MEYSNNRCGCMQRPQLPEPPHINTGNSCGPVNQRMSGNSGGCSDNRPTGSSCGCAVQRPMQPDRENTLRGCLSDMSVAMAYVPMQRWNQVYDMSRGLTRGTIFPELDLPFVMGRCR